MECPKCRTENRVAWKAPDGMYDRFMCSCGETYTRSESIMAEEARMDEAYREAAAIDESNRSQEIENERYDIDPFATGWVGRNGLP